MTTSCKTSFEKSVDIVIDDGIIDEEEAKTIMSEKPTEMTSEELVNFVMERCKKAGVDMKREDVEKALKQKVDDTKREITVSIYLDNTSSMEGYYKSRDISRFTSIISAINAAKPDLLWIGMTAPKQEKWAYRYWQELDVRCHVGTIGAVFDFYAGTAKRAPIWWQKHSLEWLYRLIKEPRRMWRRYIIGNVKFIRYILKEKSVARNQQSENKGE